jgi:hypothetical protein
MRQSKEMYGTGAAIYLDCGGVPDEIRVYNATDGDEFDVAFPRRRYIPFTSGGVQEPKVGDELVGDTTRARCTILNILKASGTWAGGDAAGFFIVDVNTHKKNNAPSNFGSENVSLVARHYVNGNASQSNVATVTAGVCKGYNSAAAVAAVDNSNDIEPYIDDGTNGAFSGVKLGTDISESGKLLIVTWYQDDAVHG